MELLLEKFNLENKTVGVAVSGGSDSMALLFALKSFSKQLNFSVKAINVEHGIRGENSVKDSLFVESYCKENDILLKKYSVDALKKANEDKQSIEQAARILRYQCFDDAINTGFCDLVATAHHQNDNIESILLNIFRGSGTKGLCGIPEILNGKIIRPFLSVNKEQITEYIKENDIPFITDESNFCDDYSRNFLRLNIIPKIKEVFPAFEKSIERLSFLSKADNQFFEENAEKIIKKESDGVKIFFTDKPQIFARAVIKALSLINVFCDYEKTHIDALYSLFSQENNKRLNLPHQVIAYKDYDGIFLMKEKNIESITKSFSVGEIDFLDKILSIEDATAFSPSKTDFYADKDKIPKTAVIRTRRDGDLFKKFGGGEKKLNDYLTDIKMPLRHRETLPLLCDGKDVLFIWGVEISDKIRVDNKTDKLIKLTYTIRKGVVT